MTGQPIRTDGAAAPSGAYSQAIAAGGFVFTSGMGPLDPKTGAVVGDTIREQTAVTLANIAAVLAAAGLDLSDVVKTTVHLQEVDRDFAAFDEVYREHFSDPLPVRTTVGSNLLGILVEIDVVAAQPT